MTLAPNSITKVRVYVYLEGQDVDNYDFASLGKKISINFGFTKERFFDEDVDYDSTGTATLPDDVIKKNQEYVNEQKEKVAAKQAELNEILTQMNQESSLSAELEAIAEQRELIEKLQGGFTEIPAGDHHSDCRHPRS